MICIQKIYGHPIHQFIEKGWDVTDGGRTESGKWDSYNFVCFDWKGVAECKVQSAKDPYLILVTAANTSENVFFFKTVPFFAHITQNLGLFWRTWAILSRIYALFGDLFTGLNSVALYQNWQISGTSGSLQNNCHNSRCYSTTIHQNTFTLTSEKMKNVLTFTKKYCSQIRYIWLRRNKFFICLICCASFPRAWSIPGYCPKKAICPSSMER